MTSCFGGGMGPKQFSDSLCIQHKETFDVRCFAYTKCILAGASLFSHRGMTFCNFGTFDGAYAGFVPSATWLCDIWDTQIEVMAPDIDQYMSMLPLDIMGMDHLHKVCTSFSQLSQTSQVLIDCSLYCEHGWHLHVHCIHGC